MYLWRKNTMKSFVIWILNGAIAFSSIVLHAQTSDESQAVAAHQKMARELFRELIEINTSLKFGSTKAVEAMAVRLKAEGFAESDIQILGSQPQNMNLVIRYRGTGVLRPILFLAHLDVVEALRQDWSFDPFTLLEKDGYFYGRGTIDDKCDCAALVANLIRLRKEGFVPNRDIIIALTANEENGDISGVEWLLPNHRDIIDAEYCINSDAGLGKIKNGEHSVMDFQTSEKSYADYRLEVTNKGGHSSLPVKDNAIYRLAGALTRIADFEFPIRLNEATRMFFERCSSREQGQIRKDMMAIAKVPFDTAAAIRLAQSSAYYNALLRTTCVATMLSGGHAENALPQSAQALLNCRMLPDETLDNVKAMLTSIVADTQVSISCLYASPSCPFMPLRKDLLEVVERLTASLWPGVVVTPTMCTGASDGRFFRLAGIPVYGVSGMFNDIDDVRAHGKDERIGVQEFYEGVNFMYKFIKTLASGS
jgi:acetylornithine deacetylase/succinyl-diaminopimelate desuccinylase-like protein